MTSREILRNSGFGHLPFDLAYRYESRFIIPNLAHHTTKGRPQHTHKHVHTHTIIMADERSKLEQAGEGTNFSSDEIDRLRKRFMKLDTDASGILETNEFLSLPGVAANPLASRLMDVFDENHSGDVDFQEFINGLSTFSTKGNKKEKLRFAFKVYDIDRDGYISNGELFIVLKMMVGNNLKDAQLQQIVDKTIMEADKDGDGKISFEEFEAQVGGTNVYQSMTLDLF